MSSNEPIRVLLVEDEPTDIEVLRRSLQRLEISTLEVSVATTGKEARHALGQKTFDLLLLDLHLPDVIGFELIQFSREKNPSLAIVVVTSLNSEEAALQAGKIGADDYIVKDDLLGSSLGRTIRRLLRSRLRGLHPEAGGREAARNEAGEGEWVSWNFPEEKVPSVSPSAKIYQEAKNRYQQLLGLVGQENEEAARSSMKSFEDFAFEMKIPAQSLIQIHKELAGNRLLMFEILAALLERHRPAITEEGF